MNFFRTGLAIILLGFGPLAFSPKKRLPDSIALGTYLYNHQIHPALEFRYPAPSSPLCPTDKFVQMTFHFLYDVMYVRAKDCTQDPKEIYKLQAQYNAIEKSLLASLTGERKDLVSIKKAIDAANPNHLQPINAPIYDSAIEKNRNKLIDAILLHSKKMVIDIGLILRGNIDKTEMHDEYSELLATQGIENPGFLQKKLKKACRASKIIELMQKYLGNMITNPDVMNQVFEINVDPKDKNSITNTMNVWLKQRKDELFDPLQDLEDTIQYNCGKTCSFIRYALEDALNNRDPEKTMAYAGKRIRNLFQRNEYEDDYSRYIDVDQRSENDIRNLITKYENLNQSIASDSQKKPDTISNIAKEFVLRTLLIVKLDEDTENIPCNSDKLEEREVHKRQCKDASIAKQVQELLEKQLKFSNAPNNQ
jgi:hypothetical protein